MYWAIMNPEPAPSSVARKAGKLLTRGFTKRSTRRSDMAAISATAIPSESAMRPSAAPTAFAPDSARGSSAVPTTTGLSVTEANSSSTTRTACANRSRAAPCTCGTARRLKGSWVRRPALCSKDGAAAQQRAQALADLRDSRRHAQPQGVGVEYRDLALQILECHCGGGIRPIEQALRPAQGDRRQARGAGSSVDEAQPLLGPQDQRRQLHRLQRFGAARWHRPCNRAVPSPISTSAMCAMCVRYPTDPAAGTSGTQSWASRASSRSTTAGRTPE